MNNFLDFYVSKLYVMTMIHLRTFVLFFILLFVFLYCEKDTSSRSDPGLSEEEMLPHSMKGYELYGWTGEEKLFFCLITGTNRLKTDEELLSEEDVITQDGWVRIKVTGVDSVKTLLRRLPPGESLRWSGPAADFSPPSEEILQEIKEYCRTLQIDINL